MGILLKLAPHAAIVIGNMYYVFWGINCVNTSMNFIDNGYTKFLLVLLIGFGALTVWQSAGTILRQLRRSRNPVPLYVRLGLLGANALLAFVILVLLIIDLFNENLMLFLNGFVQVLILVLCIVSLLNGIQAIARDRAIVRQQARRRPVQRPTAQRSQPAQPVRRYPEQGRYGQPAGYGRSPVGAARSSGSYARTDYSRAPGGYSRPSTRVPENTVRRQYDSRY